MRKLILSLLALGLIGAMNAQANLLSNASFEVQGTLSGDAEYWEWDNPNQKGSTWGTAERHGSSEGWRAYDGDWEASISGLWAGGDNGGYWQHANYTVTAGEEFESSFWAYSDANWTSAENIFKLEFFNSLGDTIHVTTNIFASPGETWTKISLSGTAPASAVEIGVSIGASGAGQDGALQFDAITLTAVPEPVSAILLTAGLGFAYLLRRRIAK